VEAIITDEDPMKKLFLFSIFICGYAIAADLDPAVDPVEEAEEEGRRFAVLQETGEAAEAADMEAVRVAGRELAAAMRCTESCSIAKRSAGRNRKADVALRERYTKAGSELKKSRAGKKPRPKRPTGASRRRLW